MTLGGALKLGCILYVIIYCIRSWLYTIFITIILYMIYNHRSSIKSFWKGSNFSNDLNLFNLEIDLGLKLVKLK